MKNLLQEIAQIGNPLDEYGKYSNDDRILFKRVHNVLVYIKTLSIVKCYTCSVITSGNHVLIN